ncbi:TRAP transporter substrate-binding protein [Oceanomicrobium pacificus]|uniref:DctP family TRAP transporter solute-binding subunit n=1 Tax=Oceanomicrobium pacificus TaxID=2692916 RepID=A0A6B0TSW6_9RHOB|nr:TRAP transporter substrate-binding protein [Oceanomicrobium pacificus]MXU64354.1 DctP family TRAP transporter solute-binding subunit [Oceanomicrobium pacificus]
MFMKVTVTAVALCGTLIGGSIAAQAETLRASLIGPIETAQGQGLQKFAELVKERSGGELEVEIYPDGQLGNLAESVEQVQSGIIDMTTAVPSILAEFVPELQVFGVPFLFRDYDHWTKVVDGEIGAEFSEMTTAKADTVILGYFGGSVRNLVTRKKVETLDDAAGLKVRLHPTEVLSAAWSSVGIQPTVLAYGEIYNGLQLGVVDGLENEPEWVKRMKFYEQAPYITLTQHEIVTRPFIFSAKTMDRLTDEQKQIILEAGAEAAAYEREIEHGLDQETLNELITELGAEAQEIDKDKFQATAAAALEPVLENAGLTATVEKIKAVE